MSQEKVERYKKEKVNRKKIIKKQKRIKILIRVIVILIALAILAFIGWSIYDLFV